MSTLIAGYFTLCRSRCGTLNEVDNNRLIKVIPNPAHPNDHAMCMKGKEAPELVYSANRSGVTVMENAKRVLNGIILLCSVNWVK